MYYFDNAATSYPKPDEVYKFSDYYYRNYGFNATRSHLVKGKNEEISPNELIRDTKKMLLDLVNAEDKEVTFLSSATIATNVVLQGLNYENISKVYISPFEHNAVIRTLHYLQKIYDFEIIELTVNRLEDSYDTEEIKYQFQKKNPDLVVVNHASNVTGLIAPIDTICNFAKKYKAITVIDIAQSAGQMDVDLSSPKYDFAIFAGHKSLLGSFGIGGFISNNKISLAPLIYGGTGRDSANPEMPVSGSERHEVGSVNILAVSSLYASLKYINSVGLKSILEKKKKMMSDLINLLEDYPDIKVYRKGANDKYVYVVSINYSGYSSNNLGEILAKKDIIVRTGLHCAPLAHKYLGTFPEGTVRLSISEFTTLDDLEKLEEAIDYIEDNS